MGAVGHRSGWLAQAEYTKKLIPSADKTGYLSITLPKNAY